MLSKTKLITILLTPLIVLTAPFSAKAETKNVLQTFYIDSNGGVEVIGYCEEPKTKWSTVLMTDDKFNLYQTWDNSNASHIM